MKLPRLPRPRFRWLRPDPASLPRFLRSHFHAKVGAALLLLVCWLLFGGGERAYWPREDVLAAIRFVESSDRDDVPDGDGGKAIGPYQIWFAYWQDAIAAEPSLGGDYQDCRRRDYAERVVGAYMRRWVPDAWYAGHAEVLARVHNGGPRGHEKPQTEGYWRRVRARLR